MHPYPIGYSRVADGDIIKEGDLALGKIRSVCGQESYGWKRVAPFLVGQELYEGAIELGHPVLLVRKNETAG
ncbi:MAG: hypothetical protein EOO53_01430 [Gammaproteobacteria bacterium]|nr:MAG: hypothetical protein EOO53_01430 [Gammaproteobacteria bacterium]